jgi:hypothetical protein
MIVKNVIFFFFVLEFFRCLVMDGLVYLERFLWTLLICGGLQILSRCLYLGISLFCLYHGFCVWKFLLFFHVNGNCLKQINYYSVSKLRLSWVFSLFIFMRQLWNDWINVVYIEHRHQIECMLECQCLRTSWYRHMWVHSI